MDAWVRIEEPCPMCRGYRRVKNPVREAVEDLAVRLAGMLDKYRPDEGGTE